MKKMLLIILGLLVLTMVGCKKSKYNGLEYEKIEANHLISDDSISSYMVISANNQVENGKFVYSMTIYSDFLKGFSRYYNYYQIDYQTTEKLEQYYHIFTFEDCDKRKFGQKFLPNYEMNELLSFDVLFEYEYLLEEEKKVNQLKYHENIIDFSDDTSIFKNNSDININFIVVDCDETNNMYKIELSIPEYDSGHIDLQLWAMTNDGKVIPLYGIYHYQVERGNFKMISSEKINKNVNLETVYATLIYQGENGSISYHQKINN